MTLGDTNGRWRISLRYVDWGEVFDIGFSDLVPDQAINEEIQLQRAKQQRANENNRNLANRNKKDIELVNWKLNSLGEEIKNIEKEITKRDEGLFSHILHGVADDISGNIGQTVAYSTV